MIASMFTAVKRLTTISVAALFVAILLTTMTAAASPNCAALFDAGKSTWSYLQRKKRLVNQNSMQGRDGLCGPACIVNEIQFLRASQGLAPLRNPQSLFRKLVAKGVADQGYGSSIPSFLQNLSESLAENGGLSVRRVRFQVIKGITNTELLARDEVTQVESLVLDDLTPRKGESKMLVSVTVDGEGNVTGQHIQIVQSYDGNTISLIEPNAPLNQMDLHQGTIVDEINDILLPRLHYTLTSRTRRLQGQGFIPIGILTISRHTP